MNGKIVVVVMVIGTAVLATGLTLSGLRPADPNGCYADLPRASDFSFSSTTFSHNGTLNGAQFRLDTIGTFTLLVNNATMAIKERPYEGTFDGAVAAMNCDEHRIEVDVSETEIRFREFSQH